MAPDVTIQWAFSTKSGLETHEFNKKLPFCFRLTASSGGFLSLNQHRKCSSDPAMSEADCVTGDDEYAELDHRRNLAAGYR